MTAVGFKVRRARRSTRPRFTCRFSWRPGSIAIWDNHCVQHTPVND